MRQLVLYWDASAVLSLLVPDAHTKNARMHASNEQHAHVVSSLTHAEIFAALARLERAGAIDSRQAISAKERFERGPWSCVTVAPPSRLVWQLAQRWRLRGAHLWHLAAALTLRAESRVEFLSFDNVLVEAARGESLSAT